MQADLEATEHDVPIPQNSRIYAYVELFQGRLRDYIEESLTRGSKYLPMIQSVFKAEGLPLDLAYIPIIESGFKTNALSKANAKGPWQFMKATAGDRDSSTTGTSTSGRIPKRRRSRRRSTSRRSTRCSRRLAPGAGGLQRRARPAAAGDEDRRHRGLLGSSPRSTRFLPKETREYVPAHPRGDRRRQEPGAVRLQRPAGGAGRVREGRWCRARSTCAASPSGPARR